MSKEFNSFPKAIILAAGRGSRMRKLTSQKPKCLMKVRGKTLLDHQIDALRSAGIIEIALVTGYLSEYLESYELLKFHNSLWAETNMVSSLACAETWLKDGPCIVSYSDIFYDSSAISSLLNCSAPLSITYDKNWEQLWSKRFSDPLTDAETFVINNKNNILEIGKKPEKLDEVQGQFMGLLGFTPKGWAEFSRCRKKLNSEVRNNIDMTSMLQCVIDSARIPIEGVSYQSEWGEVDSQLDLSHYT